MIVLTDKVKTELLSRVLLFRQKNQFLFLIKSLLFKKILSRPIDCIEILAGDKNAGFQNDEERSNEK